MSKIQWFNNVPSITHHYNFLLVPYDTGTIDWRSLWACLLYIMHNCVIWLVVAHLLQPQVGPNAWSGLHLYPLHTHTLMFCWHHFEMHFVFCFQQWNTCHHSTGLLEWAHTWPCSLASAGACSPVHTWPCSLASAGACSPFAPNFFGIKI